MYDVTFNLCKSMYKLERKQIFAATDTIIFQFHGIKRALSRLFSISLSNQNIYFCRRKPTNNGLFLLPISILVH